jgi:hypothetical protein
MQEPSVIIKQKQNANKQRINRLLSDVKLLIKSIKVWSDN